MSVADRLGTGSSFGGVPRGRSARGRAKALVQGDVPSYELSRIRLEDVAPTPLNPRRNFGSDEEMTRFGEELRNTQLAACVAISRAAYLQVWPQHEAAIGEAQYVLINGERRYRSASHVGLEALDFVVRDDLASSREAFIDHLLKENLEREDFDVVERARGVQQLVLVCSEESATGARARAAKRLGRDRSWVTNQLALLELPEELQGMLSTGSLPERDGRLLARRMKDEPGSDVPGLLRYLREQREQEAREREEAKALADQIKRQGRTATEEALARKNAQAVSEREAKAGRALSADNTEQMLSADNTGQALSADNMEQVLSADNAQQPVRQAPPAPRAAESEAAAPVPAPAAASVLAPGAAPVPAPAVAPAPSAGAQSTQDEPDVLSADNTDSGAIPRSNTKSDSAKQQKIRPTGPSQGADSSPESASLLSADNNSARSEAARKLVRQLGETPQEQARTLVAGLGSEELLQLIEELHQHM